MAENLIRKSTFKTQSKKQLNPVLQDTKVGGSFKFGIKSPRLSLETTPRRNLSIELLESI